MWIKATVAPRTDLQSTGFTVEWMVFHTKLASVRRESWTTSPGSKLAAWHGKNGIATASDF